MPGFLPFLLLFGSGLAALAYQVVWMREFRLVFGASTAATAAVSALFMAGLGLGGWLLGPMADRRRRPLLVYGLLELGIALFAAASPWLLEFTRSLYLESGGMLVLGRWGATGARLALAAVVLGVPTFLMGGTLPAAARAVTLRDDGERRSLGFLYGMNTLGALTGVLLTTFWLLEAYGARLTLFLAVAANLVVAVGAMVASRFGEGQGSAATQADAPDPVPAVAIPATKTTNGEYITVLPDEEELALEEAVSQPASDITPALILLLAGGTGFVFFLMELVWYRMLAPLLGGSTYTFGLILAVALAGIGLGGAAYPLMVRLCRPSTGLLAVTCLVEAVCTLLPFVAGDRLVMVVIQILPLTTLGFSAQVAVWTVTTLAVVFPAAFVSGLQFPLLIALLGRGRENIGVQTGRAYAVNTAGAILGSLAGGFGLMPWLTATGCWLLAGGVLALMGILLALPAWR
ncbi:MAG: fused MFS/spermidine synthase, partial [Planctomycetes bacterium]|nr:fused MFS/spermidine synthase [Planctomycetota bacterium]